MLDLDHDGWPDFLISRNNATTLAFRNQPVAGRHSLGIRLQGPPGPPHRHRRPDQCDPGRWHHPIRRGLRRLGLLQPVQGLRHLLLRLARTPTLPKALHVRWPSGITTEHSAVLHHRHYYDYSTLREAGTCQMLERKSAGSKSQRQRTEFDVGYFELERAWPRTSSR